MISIIGNLLLLSAFISSITLGVAADSLRKRNYIETIFYIVIATVILAFGSLLFAFIISDFSLENVLLNSSTIKPLIYRIAAGWASHEGSYLFFLALISLVSSVSYFSIRRLTDDLIKTYAKHFGRIFSLLIAYSLFVANPFELNSLVDKGIVIQQGFGMNPLLQDSAVAIHPPMLYLSHALYFSLFICILTYLTSTKDEDHKPLFKHMVRISSSALGLLTAGVSLGSWWAYRELGWGGYWFFDPVENISLMPWLLGIIFHHSTLNRKYYGQFNGWASFAALSIAPLIIFGMFLVRSNMITSVHSFATGEMQGVYILAMCLLMSLYAAKIYISSNAETLTLASKSIRIGNIIWLVLLSILLLSALIPIFYYLLDNQQTSVDIKFYHTSFIPAGIILCFATSIWGFKNSKAIQITFFVASTIITYLLLGSTSSAPVFIALISGILLIITSLKYLLIKLYRSQPIYPRAMSTFLSHFGFGLLVAAISINIAFQKEGIFDTRHGHTQEVMGYNVQAKNMRHAQGSNYLRKIIELWVEGDQGSITVLQPEMRLYTVENQLVPDSDIYSYLTHDLYAVISEVENENITVTLYHRPAISFIWLAAILMCGGLVVSYLCRDR